jgi:hypothetical protein
MCVYMLYMYILYFLEIKKKAEIRIVSCADVAWVTCLETYDQGHGHEVLQVLIT